MMTLICGLVLFSPRSAAAQGTSDASFAIGIEYASAGLAQVYAPTGARWAKPWPALAQWGDVEPLLGQPRWDKVDKIIKEYQEAGFEHMQILLTFNGHLGKPSDPDYIRRYAEYARRVVERYDMDGRDDMPGLRFPIHHIGVEREMSAYWPFSGDDYGRLLKAVYPVIKEADPNAQVLLNAILVADVFDGNPSPEQIQKRLMGPVSPPKMRKSGAEILASLDHPDCFDIVDFHSLGDYTEIPGTVKWLRAEMSKRGWNKPIWIGDAMGISPLLAYGIESPQKGLLSARAFFPATEATRPQAAQAISSLRRKGSPSHPAAVEWLRAEQAKGVVKKIVVAAAEGLAGINIGNLDDWPLLMAGTSAFQGMVNAPGDRSPRPAFHSLTLAIKKLTGFTRVERIPGLPEGTWTYRLAVRGKSLCVAWHEPARYCWPGEAEAPVTVPLPWDQPQAVVTPIITRTGQTTPESRTLAAQGGRLGLELTSVPVFVESP
jgi:hypothetical protein